MSSSTAFIALVYSVHSNWMLFNMPFFALATLFLATQCHTSIGKCHGMRAEH